MTAPLRPHRRSLLAALPAGVLASGCKGHAQEPPLAPVSIPPLKMVAPFPVGVCVSTGNFEDPTLLPLILQNFSQFTAEWQMKMETILKDDGGFAFAEPDRIVDFAAENGVRMHAHTLIWYAQKPAAFERIDGNKPAFQNAYRNYIAAVAGRYRGRVVSWDVVNEPVADEGGVLRECLWSKNLGQLGYMIDAYHLAREADDRALLFLNDYWLEKRPEKRRAFLHLAEQLLKSGAPLQGLGSQTHLDIGLEPGSVKAAIQDIASLGLPIHLSELDVSTRFTRFDVEGDAQKATRQARLVHETVEAFMALPERQRFAITNWGVRDSDSWMQRPPNPPGVNKPLLFDAEGRPKPAAAAFITAATGR
jgi:endo-1,4-beta-xylanase